jgi:hypothetical protein
LRGCPKIGAERKRVIENALYWFKVAKIGGGFFMKKLLLFVVFFGLLLIGCQKNPFEFIETKNGQSVFLDKDKGKVIYVDENNKIIDYLDLNPSAETISSIEFNKNKANTNKEWDITSIPGKNYSISFFTRFYNNNLLYKIKLTPYDDNASAFARTVSIRLMDRNGYPLGGIEPTYTWRRTVDDDGKPVELHTEGYIPITLNNYLEISYYSPSWGE